MTASKSDKSIKTWLKKKLTTAREQGKVYILEMDLQEIPKRQKIGFTTREPEDRLAEIKRTCFKHSSQPHTLKVVHDTDQLIVENVRRLERLVLKALDEYRIDAACDCNLKDKHHEWFDFTNLTSVETVIGFVKMWRRFMQMGPYRPDGLLSAFWVARIDAMNEAPEDMNHADLLRRWEAFVSPTWLDRLQDVVRRNFTPERKDRLLKGYLALVVAAFAVFVQAHVYSFLSAFLWSCALMLMFGYMLA